MSKQKMPQVITSFNVGDKVRIKNYRGGLAKIVESRGALGPGGALVFRVRVSRKPTAAFIELREDQLEPVSGMAKLKGGAPSKVTVTKAKSPKVSEA